MFAEGRGIGETDDAELGLCFQRECEGENCMRRHMYQSFRDGFRDDRRPTRSRIQPVRWDRFVMPEPLAARVQRTAASGFGSGSGQYASAVHASGRRQALMAWRHAPGHGAATQVLRSGS